MTSLGCRFSAMVLPGETLRVVAYDDAPNALGFETYNSAGKLAISEGKLGFSS